MPSFTSYLAVAALTSLATAITINEPGKNTIWDSAKSNTITWSSVNTDTQVVDIYLAHMSGQPTLNSLLFSNVDISKNSQVVADLQLPTGTAYQINFVAHDKPEQIYAQSQQFNITGEGVKATSTVDGYTGPTYSPSSSSSAADESSKTTLETSTKSSTADADKTSSGAASTTTSSSSSSGASNAATTTGTSSNSTVSTPSPSASHNAAVGNGAATGLAAMLFGAVAFLI